MENASYIPLFELASGGMGKVSLSVRIAGGFERLYAVKRLHGASAEEPEMRRMFVEEARLAGLLRHPNVVSVLDAGEDAEGPFLVMEWIDGIALHEFLRAAAAEGPTPVGLSCRMLAQVARGLHAAHELRTHAGEALDLVHRDVSPSNILIGFDGLVRVTDFGIAKALGGKKTTGHGILKGKFGYMSPEQLRFDQIDRRSDLFALGVVLFETLAARRLYSTDDGVEQTARRILREPAPGIRDERRDAPAALEELLYALLAKVPRARPDTALEVAERLEEIAEGLDDAPPLERFVNERLGHRRAHMSERIASAIAQVSTSPAPSRRAPRSGRLPVLALALVLVAACLVAWAWAPSRAPDEALPRAASPAPAEPSPALPVQISAPEPASAPVPSTAMASAMRARRVRRERRQSTGTMGRRPPNSAWNAPVR